MILVIGTEESDSHISYVATKLEEHGGNVAIFDPWHFPQKALLTLEGELPASGNIRIPAKNTTINLSDITAVYCRYVTDFVVEKQLKSPNKKEKEFAKNEIDAALGSLFRTLQCPWYDPPDSFLQHSYKPFQLAQLKEAGLPVPDTLVTNDPESIVQFYEKHNKQVIYKPCWFGAYTTVMSDDDLRPERLAKLANAPVCLQETVEGVDVMVYKIGDTFFSTEVHCHTLDYRAAGRAKYHKVDLPDKIKEQCTLAAEMFGLNFPLIDLRKKPDGNYVFFELNPSPIFMEYEKTTSFPIADTLAKTLIACGN